MAGIYIHIPYCKKACHYCNFHFSTSLNTKNDFIRALLKEIKVQCSYLEDAPVTTIYLGGGTPSLLEGRELSEIIETVATTFDVESVVEVTLEANPDDIDAAKVLTWKQAGINRLSIGVQSFVEADLQWMNRAHTAYQAKESIKLVQDAGLNNITIDLIYGTPTLSDVDWQQNVRTAIDLSIPHISSYALTVEPATALHHMIRNNQIAPVEPGDQARQYVLLMQWMEAAGYEHYEISNFAKPGYRSRHNSAYWDGTPYLGLGPSAHSFNGKERQWNVSNNALYIAAIMQGKVPFEKETLTPVQQLNEYTMTALRRKEGISLEHVKSHFNGAAEEMKKSSSKFIMEGMMIENENHLTLTNKGKLFADGIAAELFVSRKEAK